MVVDIASCWWLYLHLLPQSFEEQIKCDQIVTNVIMGWRECRTFQMTWNQCHEFLLTWSFVTVTHSSCPANVGELQPKWKSPDSTSIYSLTTLQVEVINQQNISTLCYSNHYNIQCLCRSNFIVRIVCLYWNIISCRYLSELKSFIMLHTMLGWYWLWF